jgi:hypothetical protein
MLRSFGDDHAFAKIGTAPFPSWRTLNLDLDIRSSNADVIAGDVFICRRTEGFSGSDIEPCPMPRAGHLVTLDFSFRQRPLFMRAGIFEREERALDVEQGDLLTLDVDESCLAGRDVVRTRYLYEFAHALTLVTSRLSTMAKYHSP